MTEKTYTIDELCRLDEYPGIAYEQKYHFSRFTGKVIKHRDYHRDYTFLGYILLFFSFSIGGWIWDRGRGIHQPWYHARTVAPYLRIWRRRCDTGV